MHWGDSFLITVAARETCCNSTAAEHDGTYNMVRGVIAGANKTTTKADVFAAGAIMWQLATGEQQPNDGVRRRPR